MDKTNEDMGRKHSKEQESKILRIRDAVLMKTWSKQTKGQKLMLQVIVPSSNTWIGDRGAGRIKNIDEMTKKRNFDIHYRSVEQGKSIE